jgi:hypothetical protein
MEVRRVSECRWRVGLPRLACWPGSLWRVSFGGGGSVRGPATNIRQVVLFVVEARTAGGIKLGLCGLRRARRGTSGLLVSAAGPPPHLNLYLPLRTNHSPLRRLRRHVAWAFTYGAIQCLLNQAASLQEPLTRGM